MQIIKLAAIDILYILNGLIIAETAMAAVVVFILFTFKKNKNANFFLALFIIIRSAAFLLFFFHQNLLLIPGFILELIEFPAGSLIGVMLFYYTSYMTGRAERLNRKDIIHFLYFIIFIVYMVFYGIIHCYNRTFGVSFKNDQIPVAFSVIGIALIEGGIINSIIYSIVSFFKVKKYSRGIKNYTSNIESMDMIWINKIIYLSTLSIFVFGFCYSISSAFPSVTYPFIFSILIVSIDLVIFIIVLFLLAFYTVNQPDLRKENPGMHYILNDLNRKNINSPAKRYETIHLDKETQESYLNMLDEYMKKNKPFLNERITIKDIADELNVPYYHLSIIINNLLNKNFCDFINEYRIREVLNILNKAKNESVNVLTIAFKCGFNSKSTFNRVFKNKTGTTPSRYKNNEQSVPSEKHTKYDTEQY